MFRCSFLRSLMLMAAALCVSGGAHGQARPAAHPPTVAKCSNTQINQAYTAMTMVPNGSGATGECNPNNYGAGSWTGMQDLEVRVAHARACSNEPWLGQIYWYVYNRNPTSTECNTLLYGGGRWSSYLDLTNKVKAYHTPAVATPTLLANQYLVDTKGNLVDYKGVIICTANTYIISQDGNGLVGPSGGTLVGPSGGTMVPQPGMVISNDGGSLTGQRSLESVGGKRVIKGTVVKK